MQTVHWNFQGCQQFDIHDAWYLMSCKPADHVLQEFPDRAFEVRMYERSTPGILGILQGFEHGVGLPVERFAQIDKIYDLLVFGTGLEIGHSPAD